MNKNNQNIDFFLSDLEPSKIINDEDINKLLAELEEKELKEYEYNYLFTEEYYNQLSLKDLIKICEFYQINKGIKGYKKLDYIHLIIAFEMLPENYDEVEKRQRYWTYMIELKNDPIMKKYILWD